jgi:hypothetical protein
VGSDPLLHTRGEDDARLAAGHKVPANKIETSNKANIPVRLMVLKSVITVADFC